MKIIRVFHIYIIASFVFIADFDCQANEIEKKFIKAGLIVTKIVGFFFIIDGFIALFAIVPIIIFGKGENVDKIFIVSIQLFAAVASIGIGILI